MEYAILRNALYQRGYNIEVLVSFEPQYAYFAKWWIQLLVKARGKTIRGFSLRRQYIPKIYILWASMCRMAGEI